MEIRPQNGLYLTRLDFDKYSESLTHLYHILYPKKVFPEYLVKNLTFCVTESCNLACTYCYERHKSNRRMSFETGKSIIDHLLNGQIFRTESTAAIVLEFIGGEPLLEIELIDRLVEYFKRESFRLRSPLFYNYRISITTNGILFQNEKVQQFIKKNKEHLSITISIDGNQELHDRCRVFPDGRKSYSIVENACKELLHIFPLSSTKLTLVPENILYLKDAIQNLHKLHYHAVYANCVFENVWNESDPKRYYQKLIELADWIIENDIYKEMYLSLFDEIYLLPATPRVQKRMREVAFCGGNGTMTAFSVSGQRYPCLRYMQHSLVYQKEIAIGDIVTPLYHTPDVLDWYQKLQSVTIESSAQGECKTCSLLHCCPTCIAWNFDYNGNPNQKTNCHCGVFKAQVAANYYYWKKLYRKLKLPYLQERNFPIQNYEVKNNDL